jgi:hypothetical protein
MIIETKNTMILNNFTKIRRIGLRIQRKINRPNRMKIKIIHKIKFDINIQNESIKLIILTT